jgi:hypothetical protein
MISDKPMAETDSKRHRKEAEGAEGRGGKAEDPQKFSGKNNFP